MYIRTNCVWCVLITILIQFFYRVDILDVLLVLRRSLLLTLIGGRIVLSVGVQLARRRRSFSLHNSMDRKIQIKKILKELDKQIQFLEDTVFIKNDCKQNDDHPPRKKRRVDEESIMFTPSFLMGHPL